MKNLLFLVFLGIVMNVHSQVAVNNDGSMPDNSAMLDVKSTGKGILVSTTTAGAVRIILNDGRSESSSALSCRVFEILDRVCRINPTFMSC